MPTYLIWRTTHRTSRPFFIIHSAEWTVLIDFSEHLPLNVGCLLDLAHGDRYASANCTEVAARVEASGDDEQVGINELVLHYGLLAEHGAVTDVWLVHNCMHANILGYMEYTSDNGGVINETKDWCLYIVVQLQYPTVTILNLNVWLIAICMELQ